MLSFVLLLLLLGAILALYFYLTWHHNYWRHLGLTTAEPLTLLGSYTSIFKPTCDMVMDIQAIYDKYKSEHRAIGVLLARVPKVLILHPELAHEVLVKNFSCYRDTITSSFAAHIPLEDKYVGMNPFWCGGDHWRMQRMHGKGGVTQVKVKQAYGIWLSNGEKLLAYIKEHLSVKGNMLDVRDLSLRYTAAVMCDFIWGIDAASLTNPTVPSNMVELSTKWTTQAFGRKEIFFATLMAPFLRKLLRIRNFPQQTDAFFSQLTKEAIELRLKAIEGGRGEAERADYLSYLLQLQRQRNLSHDELVGLALTVMIDGYDTTGDALMRVLYYLAEYVDVQHNLRTEIMNSINFDEGPLDFEKIHRLTYLEQCIYENLRIGSLVEQYTRICTKHTELPISEGQSVHIEPGTFVMVPTHQLHRDERFYAEPEQFKPERFVDGALEDYIKRGLLMPFGNGPRICMGRRVALLTLKTALVHILKHYELKLTQQLPRNDKGFVRFEKVVVQLQFKLIKN